MLIKVNQTEWPLTRVQGTLFLANFGLTFTLCLLLPNQILTVTWISDVLGNVTQITWVACGITQFLDYHFIVGCL